MKLFTMSLVVVLTLASVSCKENKQASNATVQATEPPAPTASGGRDLQVDEYPVPISRPNPAYPKAALQAHQEGTVWLNVVVNDSGKVKGVTVTKSTSPEFSAAAVEAAKQWTFQPAKKNGKAVELMVTIPFRFKLSDEGTKEK